MDDNSQDRTTEVAADLARRNPRVKVVTRRPPNGVGRALRDGDRRQRTLHSHHGLVRMVCLARSSTLAYAVARIG